MNILLMSMPDVYNDGKTYKAKSPNLALSSIAGNLDKRHKVWIADLILKRNNIKKGILEAIKKTKPEIIGLSAMTFQYDTAIKIAKFIKKLDQNIKTAIGGYHATLMHKEISESDDAECLDFIFRGESEFSFNEMINILEKKGDLRSVDGLSFKENDIFIHNKKRKLEDLNNLKPPRRDVRLWKGYHHFGRSFDMLETSRGCLLNCKFCSIRHMYGKSFRKYEVERVIKDIEEARKVGIKSIFFVDDNITLDVKRLEKICDIIIERRLNDIRYAVQASTTGIASSEKLVEKMAKAGFDWVFLGIENASEKNLKYLKKGSILEKSRKAIHYLKKNGILIIGGIIIGNPDDDLEDIKNNYDFILETEVDFVMSQIVTPYLKTELRDELLNAGLVTSNNYKYYNGYIANIKTKHLSSNELDFLKWKFNKKFSKTRNSIYKVLFKTNFFKLYPWFVIKKGLYLLLRSTYKKIKNIGKTEQELFIKHIEAVRNFNEFNI